MKIPKIHLRERVRKTSDLFAPGTILFERKKDFINQAIIEAQNLFWEEQNQVSKWSHIGFFGSDGMFYESTVKLTWHKFVYGIRITSPEKLIKEILKEDECIGLQYDLAISGKKLKQATEQARNMWRKGYLYGGLELFGTLLVLLRWKLVRDPKKRKKLLKTHNPFERRKNLYCIAFVAECLQKADLSYLEVEPSIATVDHGWFTKIKHKKRIIELSRDSASEE